MARNLFLLITTSVFLLSCIGRNDNKQKHIDSTLISDTPNNKVVLKDTRFSKTWEGVNNNLEKKYKTRIEHNDIERIYQLLTKENLININATVYDLFYPTFTVYSPSSMLKNVTVGSENTYRSKEMKVFTQQDNDFILDQLELLYTNEFKWSSLIKNTTNSDSYPRLTIGIPVFSIDKKKCIIGIEEFQSEFCSKRVSYLFITSGNNTKYYLFEQVARC